MFESSNHFIANLLDAWNSHDANRVSEFYAPDYEGVDVAQPFPQRGQDGLRQMLARYWQAFPDIQFHNDETILEGDRVALVWSARGTHQGALLNIPPTGRVVTIRGVSVLMLDKGLIARATYIWDMAGLLRAIGLLPELSG